MGFYATIILVLSDTKSLVIKNIKHGGPETFGLELAKLLKKEYIENCTVGHFLPDILELDQVDSITDIYLTMSDPYSDTDITYTISIKDKKVYIIYYGEVDTVDEYIKYWEKETKKSKHF